MTPKYLLELSPDEGWNNPKKVNLQPLMDRELSVFKRLVLKVMLKVGKAKCPNIFRTMFRNFRVYFPFVRFNAILMPKGDLPRRDTELAILRVAWKTRSYYEWGQHVEIGLRAGLNVEEIVRVTCGAESEGWVKHERAILKAVDEILDLNALSESTWSELSNYYGEKLLIELLFAITTYNGLACILNSVGVELEDDIEQVLTSTRYK